MFTGFDKAIVAFLSPVLLQVLNSFGITPDMSVGSVIPLLIAGAITGFLVWIVPNAKKA